MLDDSRLFQVRRQRQLEYDAVKGWIGAELGEHGRNRGGFNIAREIRLAEPNSELCRDRSLAPNIICGGRVVPDRYGGEGRDRVPCPTWSRWTSSATCSRTRSATSLPLNAPGHPTYSQQKTDIMGEGRTKPRETRSSGALGSPSLLRPRSCGGGGAGVALGGGARRARRGCMYEDDIIQDPSERTGHKLVQHIHCRRTRGA